MSWNLKLDTDNFLHTNPSLYQAFYGEHDFSTAYFIHRLLKEFNTGKTVLDIGSGPGREVAYLSSVGYEAAGLDNSEEMLEWARSHHPNIPFHYGDQSNFSLDQQFDSLYCVGSTFLYNFTNESVSSSLQCFRRHLQDGGLLYMDMRNAAFFLTEEGQRWLSEELVEQRTVQDKAISLKTRFRIDMANQLLERDYCWSIDGMKPIVEHLRHRLLFPQELVHHLASSGFRIISLFDKPEPHISAYDGNQPIAFGTDLLGRRMQVIAQAI